MRRYLGILLGCLIGGGGVAIVAVCVTTMNALFGGAVSAISIEKFELTVSNAHTAGMFILGFGLVLIFVGGWMVLEDGKVDG